MATVVALYETEFHTASAETETKEIANKYYHHHANDKEEESLVILSPTNTRVGPQAKRKPQASRSTAALDGGARPTSHSTTNSTLPAVQPCSSSHTEIRPTSSTTSTYNRTQLEGELLPSPHADTPRCEGPASAQPKHVVAPKAPDFVPGGKSYQAIVQRILELELLQQTYESQQADQITSPTDTHPLDDGNPSPPARDRLTEFALPRRRNKLVKQIWQTPWKRSQAYADFGGGCQRQETPAGRGHDRTGSHRHLKRSDAPNSRQGWSWGIPRTLLRPSFDNNHDKDRGDGDEPPVNHRPTGGRDRDQHLACPYFKSDPLRYVSCAYLSSPTWHGVVQHLRDKHYASPFICPHCGHFCGTQTNFDSHVVACSIVVSRPVVHPGRHIDIAMLLRIFRRTRRSRTLSHVGQWRATWNMILPNTPAAADPFSRNPLVEVTSALERPVLPGGMSYADRLISEGYIISRDHVPRVAQYLIDSVRNGVASSHVPSGNVTSTPLPGIDPPGHHDFEQ
ncbi:hypothetical protein CTRI78_v010371 [Colletotrichum trifolii]|uniref:C2H2-type domain-containing protein n=1 Tax=Colletotrichum trifolii TaxID=5466 RepID=A0A4V3HTL7_COLTR|nr:hypothetical protein CTRI78_v010371 [Colletotrichum trifolii]